jgi:hypothetical protein
MYTHPPPKKTYMHAPPYPTPLGDSGCVHVHGEVAAQGKRVGGHVRHIDVSAWQDPYAVGRGERHVQPQLEEGRVRAGRGDRHQRRQQRAPHSNLGVTPKMSHDSLSGGLSARTHAHRPRHIGTRT